MKFFSSKCLSLLLLASAFAGTMHASYDNDAGDSSCRSSCYECRCEPLYECSWGLQFDAGVRPIVWRHRDHFFTVNCLADTVLNDVGELPKFSKLYHVPFQVGGQVSYATSCNTNLFVEFNYASARAKDDHVIALDSTLIFSDASRYKLYEGYFGARYYFERWFCNCVSLFVGGKIGFVHHKSSSINFLPASTNGVLCVSGIQSSEQSLFRKNTVFAGGGQLGFDICINGTWSFVITAEVVANCGPKAGGAMNLCFDSLALNDVMQILTPGIETELAFPVTFGLKYNY